MIYTADSTACKAKGNGDALQRPSDGIVSCTGEAQKQTAWERKDVLRID
jgi:hypothetical protein